MPFVLLTTSLLTRDQNQDQPAMTKVLTQDQENAVQEFLKERYHCLISAFADLYIATPSGEWSRVGYGILCYVINVTNFDAKLVLLDGLNEWAPNLSNFRELWSLDMLFGSQEHFEFYANTQMSMLYKETYYATICSNDKELFSATFSTPDIAKKFVETVNHNQKYPKKSFVKFTDFAKPVKVDRTKSLPSSSGSTKWQNSSTRSQKDAGEKPKVADKPKTSEEEAKKGNFLDDMDRFNDKVNKKLNKVFKKEPKDSNPPPPPTKIVVQPAPPPLAKVENQPPPPPQIGKQATQFVVTTQTYSYNQNGVQSSTYYQRVDHYTGTQLPSNLYPPLPQPSPSPPRTPPPPRIVEIKEEKKSEKPPFVNTKLVKSEKSEKNEKNDEKSKSFAKDMDNFNAKINSKLNKIFKKSTSEEKDEDKPVSVADRKASLENKSPTKKPLPPRPPPPARPPPPKINTRPSSVPSPPNRPSSVSVSQEDRPSSVDSTTQNLYPPLAPLSWEENEAVVNYRPRVPPSHPYIPPRPQSMVHERIPDPSPSYPTMRPTSMVQDPIPPPPPLPSHESNVVVDKPVPPPRRLPPKNLATLDAWTNQPPPKPSRTFN